MYNHLPIKLYGPRWRALLNNPNSLKPKPKPGDRVLLRNDEEDTVETYNEGYKMYTLQNHRGLFSTSDLIVIENNKK